MDIYLVHIYRRENGDGSVDNTEVFGIVEGIENEQQIPFTSANELWDIVTGMNLAGTTVRKKMSRKVQENEK